MLQERALRRHLSAWPLVRIQETLWREIDFVHLAVDSPQPLFAEGPVIRGARFTPPGGFATLYLTFDRSTTSLEIGAIFRHADGRETALRERPTTLIPVRVELSGVLDLGDASLLKTLRTSDQELTGEWRFSQARGIEPATQRLGRIAHETGRIRGLRYRSAKVPERFCLAVFVDRLDASSDSIASIDPDDRLVQQLPTP